MTNDNSQTSGFLTVAELAKRWACGKTVIYDEIKAGRLRALTIGAQGKRIAVAEMRRYETERTGMAS